MFFSFTLNVPIMSKTLPPSPFLNMVSPRYCRRGVEPYSFIHFTALFMSILTVWTFPQVLDNFCTVGIIFDLWDSIAGDVISILLYLP